MRKELYGLDKKDSFKVWKIEVVDHAPIQALIRIVHGKEDGKLTEKLEYVTEGKQGRDVWDQAILQAKARIKKQMDKGYRETKEELNDLPLLAMLAEDYNKKGSAIKFPCYTSVKYDGVRCMAIKHCGEVRLESRTGQEFVVPHIQEYLNQIMCDGQSLDGELYKHGNELQDILSSVKRRDPQKEIDKAFRKMQKDNSEKNADEYDSAVKIAYLRDNLEFHMFDIPMDGDFETRLSAMDELFAFYKHTPFTYFTKYDWCKDELELLKQHAQAVKDGFEGVMLRNLEGVYESGKRSSDLQKYKTFLDEEFEIIDVIPDKDDGGIFVLRNTVNDLTFQCVMGTMAERKYQLQYKNREFIGKWLKVKFQTRYKGTLLPQFPTGVMVRDGYKVGREFVPYD